MFQYFEIWRRTDWYVVTYISDMLASAKTNVPKHTHHTIHQRAQEQGILPGRFERHFVLVQF